MPRLCILHKGEGSIAGVEMLETGDERNFREDDDLDAEK